MKLQKLALTALALSMSTAFAGGNKDKQAEASSANQAPMAQSATANQPSSSTANQAASSTANQAASSSTNQAASSTNGSQSASSDTSSSQGATAAADPQARQVQQALKDKGHDPGPVDGVMGPQTQGALQSFQQAQGISGSGQLDQPTLAALGIQRDGASQGSSISSSTNQPSSGAQASSSSQASPSSANQAASSSANQGSTKQ